VDEVSAQRLADETGRVTYLRTKITGGPDCALLAPARLTTDREEAVGWGESVAFVPSKVQPVPEWRSYGLSNYRCVKCGGSFASIQDVTRHWCIPTGKSESVPLADPPEQLRVVRVLEYRGPRQAIEKILAESFVSPAEPKSMFLVHSLEITELTRTKERLCRWCGSEHLGACSEEECSANPRKGRY
jgi:hypothetical protein